jgi:hypothetical protein
MDTKVRLSKRHLYLLVCLFLMLLAAILRFHRIAQRSLWLDEAIAANISRGTLPQTVILTWAFHSAPIVDPLTLYAVEKVSTSPFAVRLPAVVASLLAVLMMLCMARLPSVGYRSAGLAGLMMSVSSFQVRYAQEVREYSLSVLYAVLLLFLFLSCTRNETSRGPIPLYLALFVAPFVQYGLAIFGCGILSALLILAVTGSRRRKLRQLAIASGSLAVGGTLSFLLTLRYQWGDAAPYLDNFYYSHGTSLIRFTASNTHHIVTAFLPGLGVGALATIAVCFSIYSCVRNEVVVPLVVLAFTSMGTVLACGILHKYPYGAIRQCLFLSPVLCVFAAVSLVQLCNRFRGNTKQAFFAVVVCTVVLSGVVQIRDMKPYAEIENIQAVLSTLRGNLQPQDSVYIYPGAVPAVDYYVKTRDPHFIYGNYHQEAPDQYLPEILSHVNASNKTVWLVFSHIYRDEDQRIIRSLNSEWSVGPVLAATGSSLYRAQRRSAPGSRSPNYAASAVAYSAETETAISERSFWDWNIQNCSRPVCKSPGVISQRVSLF